MKFPLTKISASTLNCYLNCPLAFKLTYIDGYETKEGKALQIGSMFDFMFKQFHEKRDWLESTKKKFFSTPPSQQEIDNFSDARKMMDEYVKLPHTFHTPKFDVPFKIPFPLNPEISLTGWLDGIDTTPLGVVGIEAKTTANADDWSQQRCDTEKQATFYAYYLFNKCKVSPPIKINYIVFDKKTKKREEFITTRDMDDFAKLFNTIKSFIDDVEHEKFNRNPDHAYYCACRSLSKELNL